MTKITFTESPPSPPNEALYYRRTAKGCSEENRWVGVRIAFADAERFVVLSPGKMLLMCIAGGSSDGSTRPGDISEVSRSLFDPFFGTIEVK